MRSSEGSMRRELETFFRLQTAHCIPDYRALAMLLSIPSYPEPSTQVRVGLVIPIYPEPSLQVLLVQVNDAVIVLWMALNPSHCFLYRGHW